MKVDIVKRYLGPVQQFLSEDVVLAGGSLRKLFDLREKIEDYDLFFICNAANFKTLVSITKRKLIDAGYVLIFECENQELFTYISGNNKIQLIAKQPYSSVGELLESFDFTCCCMAYDGKTFYIHVDAIRSIKNKVIYVNKITYPLSSIKRLLRFSGKGYKINDALEETVRQINQMRLNENNMVLYVD